LIGQPDRLGACFVVEACFAHQVPNDEGGQVLPFAKNPG
jgi:hypothetical protein